MKNPNEPHFYTTKRDKKVALWVDGYNIWDLSEKEATENVKKAIVNSFYLGAKMMWEKMTDQRFDGQLSNDFEKEM